MRDLLLISTPVSFKKLVVTRKKINQIITILDNHRAIIAKFGHELGIPRRIAAELVDAHRGSLEETGKVRQPLPRVGHQEVLRHESRGLGLDHGFVQQLGIMSHACHKHAICREINGPQFDMRFLKETVVIQ